MDYPEIIKLIRGHLNLSQEDLARELEVSFATVNRWENGKSAPSKMAKRLLLDLCRDKELPNEIVSKILETK